MSIWRAIIRKPKGFMFRHMRAMMTCTEFEEFVLDYFEDRLAPAPKRVFERHMKMCPECRDYLEAYRHAVEVGKTVFKQARDMTPAEVPEDLVTAILAARSAERDDAGGGTS